MSENKTPPTSISGGCLCGSVRYELNFSDSFPWPPESSSCQCTMCRKWTASLIPQFLVVKPEAFPAPLSSCSFYKEYESSPQCYRGFCSNCGSNMIWRSVKEPRFLDLFLGTLDEKWLIGERDLDATGEGERKPREGAWIGKVLARPNGTQFYLENFVEGVTDSLQRCLREYTRRPVPGSC